ncbi:MAG TPA: family 43 glycosylhydrolase [Cyclobacteriaceae bacterium]|nr:family 43 glycosylhydrolase [Cyclobacteriaceae bacterium]
MKKNIFLIFSSLFVYFSLNAQNPIVPPGMYIADPSAHVWQDGKLYVYGSRDENPTYYCSWTHHVLSSSDLLHWTVKENSFVSKGPGDQVPYSDNILYAPDAQYFNGTYYLYYCLASNTMTEGVAISLSPEGPFVNGQVLNTGGINEIDPCVFIDDDGQGYYIWGQFNAKMAKLKPNMIELDLTTIRSNIVTEEEHLFHEGGYLVKRKGIYYFVYAHMGRAGRPTCIGYSTSASAMGPYSYGGVIIDNDHCDPAVWNNHGSIVEFKGQWYVLYHRSTHNSVTMRKACVELISFNDDGSINEVEMTTQGAGGPLNAIQEIDAARACLLYGSVRITADSPSNEILSGIRNDDKAAFKYIDFGSGINEVSVRVAPGKTHGRIEVVLDHSWDRPVASIPIPGGDDGKVWKEFSAKVSAASSVHALWLRFYGTDDNLFTVDSFKFIK